MIRRRLRKEAADPAANAERLLAVLRSNLETATEPDLRRRLQRVIERLEEKQRVT
jgi:hypothetical protein